MMLVFVRKFWNKIQFFVVMAFCLFGLEVLATADCNDLMARFLQERSEFLEMTVQTYKGEEYTVIAPKGKTILNRKKLFNGEDQVVLGINQKVHYYVSAGRTRVSGDVFPFTAYRNYEGISDGYLFYFPHISKETIVAFQEEMAKTKSDQGFSFSCVSRSCAILKNKFGIKINDHTGPYLFPKATLDKMLKNGFVDRAGSPIPVLLIKTSSKVPDLKDLNEVTDFGVAIVVLGRMAFFGTMLYMFFMLM